MSVEKESVGFFESLFPRDDEKFENHQMWWGVSTGSALIGVQSFSEIVGATVAHIVAWNMGGQGPSVIYNFLSGIRIHRKQYNYAVIPLGTDVYDFQSMGTNSNVAHAAALLAGYIASQNKFV